MEVDHSPRGKSWRQTRLTLLIDEHNTDGLRPHQLEQPLGETPRLEWRGDWEQLGHRMLWRRVAERRPSYGRTRESCFATLVVAHRRRARWKSCIRENQQTLVASWHVRSESSPQHFSFGTGSCRSPAGSTNDL